MFPKINPRADSAVKAVYDELLKANLIYLCVPPTLILAEVLERAGCDVRIAEGLQIKEGCGYWTCWVVADGHAIDIAERSTIDIVKKVKNFVIPEPETLTEDWKTPCERVDQERRCDVVTLVKKINLLKEYRRAESLDEYWSAPREPAPLWNVYREMRRRLAVSGVGSEK